MAVSLLTIRYEVISMIFSTSINPFSFNVFPVETKSTILELKSNLGAISNAPFNFKHSACTPLKAKCFFVILGYLVAIFDNNLFYLTFL